MRKHIFETPYSNNTREDSTDGHHQMVNTEIRLIILFVGKCGDALYSQQKQDQELHLGLFCWLWWLLHFF